MAYAGYGADLWPIYVLIVEDEPIIRADLADELRQAGFTVIEAANADEALGHYAAMTEIDLVFTDVKMPGSLDGLELARRIQEDNPFLPLIITSGNEISEQVGDLGRFLPKPYSADEAVALVFKALGLRPSAH